MPLNEFGDPTETQVYTNTGTLTHYIYLNDQFIKALEPNSCFGYFIEEGFDLRVSLTPPIEE